STHARSSMGSARVPIRDRKDALKARRRMRMARVLSVASHATDDPTKASLAFITAVGAGGADKGSTIAPVGEAVTMVKEAIAKGIHGVGFPPLTELIAKVVEAKIPVFV